MKSSVGEMIREARAEQYGLREFAKVLDISPTYLSDIENDRRAPSEELLRLVAQHLKLNFEELMARSGRLGDETQRYVAKMPQAVSLFRKVSEYKLSSEDLLALEKRVDSLAKKKGKATK